MISKSQSPSDQWSRWLLDTRFGGDQARRDTAMQYLLPIRDRVLDEADLLPGETLLDVGTGDGLVAFGALERWPNGRVIFSDISQPLVDHVRALAEELGVAERAQFVRAEADDLAPIARVSVDAVTMRSVLIYVRDKQTAFHEFARVLKPGGRLSLFEPINSFAYPEPADRFGGFDVSEVIDEAERVKQIFRVPDAADADPMLNFNEHDLVRMAKAAGFVDVAMDLQIDVDTSSGIVSFEAWLRTAPNPTAPPMRTAIEQALSPGEAADFVDHLRRQAVAGEREMRRFAVCFLAAVKK